jgi:DNA-binding NarL/FixJ family response regulator
VNSGLKRSRRVQKTMDRPYYILLADDHVRFRRAVRNILEEIPGVIVTGEAGNRRELFELLRQSPPKLVILDIAMPDLRAGEGTQLIKLNYPDTKVLIMVMDQETEYLNHGLAAGAAGVLPKQYVASQIARAIAAIRQGKIYLPPQAPGKNSPRIAAPTAIRPGRCGRDHC